jgi:excisionase family DNA binding protein
MTAATRDSGDGCITSGDISRALGVDLKTVHRWVTRGTLHGRRTKGGHLRFRRMEVVRFLRHRRQRVPEELRVVAPRVLLVGGDATPGAAGPSGLFDALLELASGEYDVVALDLDELEIDQALAFARTLRRYALTQAVSLIGVTRWPDRRHALLTAGADLIVNAGRELTAAVSYVTGEPVQFGPTTVDARAAVG